MSNSVPNAYAPLAGQARKKFNNIKVGPHISGIITQSQTIVTLFTHGMGVVLQRVFMG